MLMAHFYASATRPIFTGIPKEDESPGDKGYVAQLDLSLHGPRDAAMNWAATSTKLPMQNSFGVGKCHPAASPTPIGTWP